PVAAQARVRADLGDVAAAITPALVPMVAVYAGGLGWTIGALADGGWLDWLAALPLEQRLILPDGTRVLAAHTAPGRNHGPGIEPDTSAADLRGMLSGCEADLVLVGD